MYKILSSDLHRMSQDTQNETEAHNNHLNFSKSLIDDQYKCSSYPEHSLIDWFTGDPPGFIETAQQNTSLQYASTTTTTTAAVSHLAESR